MEYFSEIGLKYLQNDHFHYFEIERLGKVHYKVKFISYS
jgi:hypothetical protein